MRLIELRKSKNLTQEQISKMLNISQRTYSAYELKQTEPNINTITILANFYNVSIDYLLGREYIEPKTQMNLKQLRTAKNMTQADVGKLLNITPATYNGYEKEKYEPTIKTLCTLADFYNVSLDYLIGRDFAEVKDSNDQEILEVFRKLDISGKAKVLGYAKARLDAQAEIKDIKVRTGYRG